MSPPLPRHPGPEDDSCPHDDKIELLCANVSEIRDGLLGCIETGETGLIARLKIVERDIQEIKANLAERDERRKFKEQTWYVAIVGAVISIALSVFALYTGSK